jgi:uncharacterized membrane protein
MFPKRAWFGLGLASLFAACSGDPAKPDGDGFCDGLKTEQLTTGPRDACPNDLPSDSDCAAVPSYQTDVAPLISTRCSACHGDGGIEASFPLAPHAKLFAQRRTALNQIFTCGMPPACAHGLEPDERATLLQWFVCGALDN